MQKKILTASSLVLAGCALFALQPLASASAGEGTKTENPRQSKAPAAIAVGEPVSCIWTVRIRDTDIHDDQTIDFEMNGGKIYRNTLPFKCPGLGFEEAFSYRSTTSQLCSVDTIKVLRQTGGYLENGPSCGLGKFQEVKLVKDDAGEVATD